MADEIKVKMSEFAEATQINNADDIIILQNGENKKVKSPILESKIINRTVEVLSADGGVALNLVNLKGVVDTYANLPTTGLQVNDAYQVESDGLVYTWNGTAFQANGQGFKVQPNVNGVVEQGNTNAVSGGEVFGNISSKVLRFPPFDVNSNMEWVNNGVILDIRKNNLLPDNITSLYITALRNSLDPTVKLIQLRDSNSESGNLLAQWSLNSVDYKTGTEWIDVNQVSSSGVNVKILIDWDKLPKDSTQRKPLGIVLDKLALTADIYGFQRIENLEIKSLKIDTLEKFETKVNTNVFRKSPFSENLEYVDNGFLIGITRVQDIPISGDIYLRSIKNDIGTNGGLIQFHSTKTGYSPVAQWLDYNSTEIKTGIQTISIRQVSNSGLFFNITVDWDKVASGETLQTNLKINLNNVYDTLDIDGFQRIEDLEFKTSNVFPNELASKELGNILPNDFKSKFYSQSKDLEIILNGDSLTGLLSSCSEVPISEAKHLPPACNYNHWTKLFYDAIIRNKPLYDRFDSSIYNYVGTWTQQTEGKFNTPDWAGMWSVGDLTYQTNGLSSSVSFDFDTNNFEKLNIFHTKHIDGSSDIDITINEGNGILLVSEDKENWVEANGFNFSQKTNPDSLTDTQLRQQGISTKQRARILWFKRVDSSGVITITMTNNTSDFMYFWGTCKWNGNTTFITNLGRGGRQTWLQRQNLTDITDRNPDLVIYEMALANEISQPLSEIVTWYNQYLFNGSNNVNLKYHSQDFTKFQVVLLMPHGRATYWNENSCVDWTHTGVPNDFMPYLKTRMIYQSLIDLNEFEDKVTFGDIQQLFISESFYRNMTIQYSLSGNNENKTFTTDGIHFSDYGSKIYNKYLSGIFL